MIDERKTPGALATPGVLRRIAQCNRRSPATETSLTVVAFIIQGTREVAKATPKQCQTIRRLAAAGPVGSRVTPEDFALCEALPVPVTSSEPDAKGRRFVRLDCEEIYEVPA